MTNREALQMGLVPCESNSIDGTPSLWKDEFHGVAVITIRANETTNGNENNLSTHESLIHVCFNCAAKHFKSCYAWETGVIWTK